MTEAADKPVSYPWGDILPEIGGSVELLPGVRWLRMRLPFVLDHINLWLLRDELDGRAGWTVVDCGLDSPETRAAWQQVFDGELEGLPVLRVVVTHMHPDHIGLAHWLCERWSTPEHPCLLWISGTDWNAARVACHAPVGWGGASAVAFFERHGLRDPEALEAVRGRRGAYAKLVPEVPHVFHRLMDGMVLTIGGRPWHCIAGYGHAPEHIALYCPSLELLISGDMVLPRISTNVSVYDIEPESDPLRLFMQSLSRMRELPGDPLVLPSHGKPFRGLHGRIDALLQHHEERFEATLGACREAPCSAADLLGLLFNRPLDAHQKTFAMGESLAHLHALRARGLLVSEDGADGVRRFRAVAMAP